MLFPWNFGKFGEPRTVWAPRTAQYPPGLGCRAQPPGPFFLFAESRECGSLFTGLSSNTISSLGNDTACIWTILLKPTWEASFAGISLPQGSAQNVSYLSDVTVVFWEGIGMASSSSSSTIQGRCLDTIQPHFHARLKTLRGLPAFGESLLPIA